MGIPLEIMIADTDHCHQPAAIDNLVESQRVANLRVVTGCNIFGQLDATAQLKTGGWIGIAVISNQLAKVVDH